MTASFDKQQLMAGLAELEKRVQEQRHTGRPAAAPSERLDLDLAAIEAAVKSRSASKPTPVTDAAPSADDWGDRTAPSRSTTLDVVPARELRASSQARVSTPDVATPETAALRVDPPRDRAPPPRSATIELIAEKDFRASASGRGGTLSAAAARDAARVADGPPDQPPPPPAKTNLTPPLADGASPIAGKASAPSRPHRWIYAATAILIVIGSLVGGAGWLAGGKVLAALQAPRTPSRFAPSPEADAVAAPATELRTDAGSAAAPPAAAEEAAAAAAPASETAPPEAASAAPAVEAAATQAAEAVETPPAAPAAVAAAPAVAPTPAAKAVAIVEQPPAASPSPAADSPLAKPAKPAKKPKKPTADKSEQKSEPGSKPHAKAKPAKVAKPHAAPEALAPQSPSTPQALAAPPPPAAANPDQGVLARAGQAVGSITGTVKGWVGLDSGAHP